MNTVSFTALWKTPVENSVENVENSELSTGISLSSLPCTSCGELCIIFCIISFLFSPFPCYVIGNRKILPVKKCSKSLQIVKK